MIKLENGIEVEMTAAEEAAHLAFLASQAPTLSEAKAIKLAGILAAADAAARAIKAGYSTIEQESWPKQEAEAKSLSGDPNAPAPLLRGMAARRGVDVRVLMRKVLTNVSRAEAATSMILGTQQRLEDRVRAAGTVDAVQAIRVVIP